MTPSVSTVRIDDVVAIAESFEASAAKLYRQAAESSSSRPEVRQTLLGLAEMEDSHLRAFTELRHLLSNEGSARACTGREAELLQAWLGREVFADEGPPSPKVDLGQSVESWLDTAVGMEKESIAFYSGMRSLVSEKHRRVLETIIEEEVYHLASLSYLLGSLRRGIPPGSSA